MISVFALPLVRHPVTTRREGICGQPVASTWPWLSARNKWRCMEQLLRLNEHHTTSLCAGDRIIEQPPFLFSIVW